MTGTEFNSAQLTDLEVMGFLPPLKKAKKILDKIKPVLYTFRKFNQGKEYIQVSVRIMT
jgi:hypothetical protein